MLLAIVEDPRGLLIRLADQLVRLHTASTLDTATRRRLGEDTLAVFAPLAGRLGVAAQSSSSKTPPCATWSPRVSTRYPTPSSARTPSANATSQGSSPTFGASFRWPASQPRIAPGFDKDHWPAMADERPPKVPHLWPPQNPPP
ncbi:MAG: HD domain-containing protein [Gammaproteobacteria bacterium]